MSEDEPKSISAHCGGDAPSAGIQCQAAVDAQNLAVHEPCTGTTKKDHRIGDFGWFGIAIERSTRGIHLVRLDDTRRLEAGGLGRPRAHGIDPYACVAHLCGEATRVSDNRRFEGRIDAPMAEARVC